LTKRVFDEINRRLYRIWCFLLLKLT